MKLPRDRRRLPPPRPRELATLPRESEDPVGLPPSGPPCALSAPPRESAPQQEESGTAPRPGGPRPTIALASPHRRGPPPLHRIVPSRTDTAPAPPTLSPRPRGGGAVQVARLLCLPRIGEGRPRFIESSHPVQTPRQRRRRSRSDVV